jgi:hypothetical protein
MNERTDHWNTAYATKGAEGVSWFQDEPARSLRLVEATGVPSFTPIIDVGGGASRLVDALIRDRYTDLTVLDISSRALEASKARLGESSASVEWIVADVTEWSPHRTWGVWHDRAVFHFLISATDQDAYLRALRAGTASGSTAIFATFSLDGPQRCSGLPVQRYSPETLQRRLGSEFTLVDQMPETHHTPGGVSQSFSYSVFRRL